MSPARAHFLTSLVATQVQLHDLVWPMRGAVCDFQMSFSKIILPCFLFVPLLKKGRDS